MQTIKNLHVFWRNATCPQRFKILAADAVIRSKLLYGMDSAQLTLTTATRLDTLQLKNYRKILHMDTTYINRANTNEKVIQKTEQIRNQNWQHRGNNKYKEIELFSTKQKH